MKTGDVRLEIIKEHGEITDYKITKTVVLREFDNPENEKAEEFPD